MYQALYRKYRPADFSDVCGQDHITSVLRTQVSNGRVSHAYIFCGSRGTGKTTCAKILAKAVNCENPQNGDPCNECESCRAIRDESVMDVVEMDAASNNGVDHIRRLCDEVQYLPTQLKKRVYIIDEVHMLSTSAFNALLKTIEEPPSHVLFILATTEMDAIPATILSRCQRFDFKRISPEVIATRLSSIANEEGIAIDEKAAITLARLADGALRDALSLLEACQNEDHSVTVDSINERLGLSSRGELLELIECIAKRDTVSCIELVSKMYERLGSFKFAVEQMILLYRDLMLIKTLKQYRDFVDSYGDDLKILEHIAELHTLESLSSHIRVLEEFYVTVDRISSCKKASVEILMVRLCCESLSDDTSSLLARISRLESAVEKGLPLVSAGEDTNKEVPVQTLVAPQTETVGGMQEKSGNESSEFSGKVKLKNQLLTIPFLKPWVPQLEFIKQGQTLHILCGAFAKGVLGSDTCRASILECASKVDPEISAVSVEAKANTDVTPNTDLNDL